MWGRKRGGTRQKDTAGKAEPDVYIDALHSQLMAKLAVADDVELRRLHRKALERLTET